MTASNVNFSRLNDCCDALRANPDPASFNMLGLHHPCNSPACVLGHYEHYILKERRFSNIGACVSNAAEHFGLTYDEGCELFDADGCGYADTAQEAINYIEGFIRVHGGEVRGLLNQQEKPPSPENGQ